MNTEIFNLKKYKFEWSHLAILLVFLFPLFTNTIRHWASSGYVLLALWAAFAMWKYSFDLRKEEKIFLSVIALHVLSTAISNTLSGWTYASKTWFFSGDVRFIFAIPIYLYLRNISGIWRYFIAALPFGAIVIGLTGIIDFMLRYMRSDVGEILAEGIYGHIFQGNIAALWSVLSYAAIEYYKNNDKIRVLCVAGAVLAAVGALVSVTRNAWLSLILLYAFVFVIQGGVTKVIGALGVRKITAITFVLMSAIYFLSGIEYVKDRFIQVYEEPVMYFTADRSQPIEYRSLTFRLEQWRGAIYAFQEKPVFGHGVGNSGKVHNRYIKEGRLNEMIYQEPAEKYGSPSHVHSAYFEYLGDAGVVGFVLIILVIFYAPYVAYRSRSNGGLAWKFVVLHGVAFGLASLTEVPFIRNNWTSVFLVSGIIFFIWFIREQDELKQNSLISERS